MTSWRDAESTAKVSAATTITTSTSPTGAVSKADAVVPPVMSMMSMEDAMAIANDRAAAQGHRGAADMMAVDTEYR